LKCNQEQAEAIVRLQALPEWNVFLSLIATHAEILNQTLIMKDDVKLDLVRGELRGFVKLTDAINGAPELLRQFQEPQT